MLRRNGAVELQVAEECDDPQMTDYVEGTFLADQVDAIKRVSEYVSQLRRVGPGHGASCCPAALPCDAALFGCMRLHALSCKCML